LRATVLRHFLLGDVRVAGFTDLGYVSDDFTLPKDFVIDPRLGFSVGAGLRYVLPVGPVSFDFAYAPLQSQWRMHVLFGYVF
jgi:outer membrane translocation and assembly module TamA